MGASSPKSSRRGRGRGGFTEINVTPFVDVMLVLLIIFMVTAPMLTAGVEVDLPETKAPAMSGQDEPLSVSVKKDGSIYIQDTQYNLEEVAPKIKAIAGENKEKRIIVRGDSHVDYGAVIQVMGEIRAAGFSKVSLETDIKK